MSAPRSRLTLELSVIEAIASWYTRKQEQASGYFGHALDVNGVCQVAAYVHCGASPGVDFANGGLADSRDSNEISARVS